MNTTFAECQNCRSINKLDSHKAMEKTSVCGNCGSKLSMHGLVSEVSAGGLRKILKNASGAVVVDFWASWCGPCRAYAPEFQKASLQNTEVIFLKVNTETEQQLSAIYNIRGIPCTILFKNGEEIRRQSGAMNAAQINLFVSQ
jgi:thioredoxin 2